MSDDARPTGDDEQEWVYEIELRKHGHEKELKEADEEEIVVFVVASSKMEAADKACDLQIEKKPNWHTDDTTWLNRGPEGLEEVEWRQFIDTTQDNVLVGPEVPV